METSDDDTNYAVQLLIFAARRCVLCASKCGKELEEIRDVKNLEWFVVRVLDRAENMAFMAASVLGAAARFLPNASTARKVH